MQAKFDLNNKQLARQLDQTRQEKAKLEQKLVAVANENQVLVSRLSAAQTRLLHKDTVFSLSCSAVFLLSSLLLLVFLPHFMQTIHHFFLAGSFSNLGLFSPINITK